MVQETSISTHLVSLEEVATENIQTLNRAKENLQQLIGQIEQLTQTNLQASEDVRYCQEKIEQTPLNSILSSIDDVVWSIVPQTREILYLNHATKAVYGRPMADFLENWNLWQDIIHQDDRQRVEESEQLLSETGRQEIEYRIHWPDGSIHWIRVRSHLIRDDQGNPIRIDGITTEITEQTEINKQLRYDALHDTLTKLPNRNLLMDRIEQAFKRFERDENKRFALLFLDLDGFKLINDNLGHPTGDQLLQKVSTRFSQCLRSEDTLARLGGDEFVILLENVTEVEQATTIADRIHESLREPIILQNQETLISVSIGIILGGEQPFCNSPDRVAELLRDADTAMYRAKRRGPGTSEIFEPSMHTSTMQRLQLTRDLDQAIEREELRVYYQPIVSLSSDRIDGFEALVRWDHQEHGLLFPNDFIPIAEQTERILAIDQWVLSNACHQLVRWQEQFPNLGPLTMSVNLSSKHLSKPGLIEVLDKILAETRLEGTSLKLEITESLMMEQTKTTFEILEQIKERNIEICLDDFGTGYSSLSYLDCFSFNVLKLDSSFIKRLAGEEDRCEIIEAIVNLAITLNMEVVAEGIETDGQRDKLKALNCNYGQGYGFFPPLNSAKVTNILKEKNTATN